MNTKQKRNSNRNYYYTLVMSALQEYVSINTYNDSVLLPGRVSYNQFALNKGFSHNTLTRYARTYDTTLYKVIKGINFMHYLVSLNSKSSISSELLSIENGVTVTSIADAINLYEGTKLNHFNEGAT